MAGMSRTCATRWRLAHLLRLQELRFVDQDAAEVCFVLEGCEEVGVFVERFHFAARAEARGDEADAGALIDLGGEDAHAPAVLFVVMRDLQQRGGFAGVHCGVTEVEFGHAGTFCGRREISCGPSYEERPFDALRVLRQAQDDCGDWLRMTAATLHTRSATQALQQNIMRSSYGGTRYFPAVCSISASVFPMGGR